MACARRPSRRVQNQVHLPGANQIHNGFPVIAGLGDVGVFEDGFALHAVAAQHGCGAGGGEHGESEGGEALDGENEGAFVPVGDGDEDGAGGGEGAEGCLFGFGVGGAKVVGEAHDFAGGFHFRGEEGVEGGAVGAAEPVEGEDGFFHGDGGVEGQGAAVVVGGDESFGFELGDGGAGHDAGGGFGEVDAGGFGDEGDGAGGAGVGFDDVEDVVFEGELDVHEAVDADAVGEGDGGGADFVDVFGAEGHGWEGAGGVAGVDAGFFDVFHDAGEVDVGAVAEGVDVDFDGVVEEAVDEDGVVGGDFGGSLDVVGEGGFVVDDFHAAAAEDVGGADEDGVADVVGDVFSFGEAGGGAEGGCGEVGGVEYFTEFAAVFGEVDGFGSGADDWDAGVAEFFGESEGGLAAELDDDAGDGAGLGFGVVDLHDVFEGEGFEVEAVGGVVVGGYGFGVAVDHDGFVSDAGEF